MGWDKYMVMSWGVVMGKYLIDTRNFLEKCFKKSGLWEIGRQVGGFLVAVVIYYVMSGAAARTGELKK